MKKIKILLTFDYELPLGQCTDYERGLFKPAAALLELANKLRVPIVLFADVCSAIRFEQWDKEKYYGPFVAQLHTALRAGHDVQLHIHPHWLTSTFADGMFHPSLDYSLSQFSDEKNGLTIESIMEEAFQKLREICSVANKDYQCIAYRAGGYDVEPESSRILHKLHALGVGIDSSVIKGYYLDYGFSKVDYSNSPATSSWKVSLDGPLIRAASAGVLELPVTSKPLSISNLVSRRIRKLTKGSQLKSRVYAHGGKGFLSQQGGQTLTSSLRKIVNPMVLSLDREYLDESDLLAIVDYNIAKYKDEPGDVVITAIGHPKSMGKYHLDVMERFVRGLQEKFGQHLSFVTYRDIQY